MTIPRLRVLAAVDQRRVTTIIEQLSTERPRGRPWSRSLQQRLLLTCFALRTNLTFRELAALVGRRSRPRTESSPLSSPRLVALAGPPRTDRRWSWIVDGTLIPTRDHTTAARSKNYRWSCNAQVLVRRRDLYVIATSAGGPGNRNDPVHYRGSSIEPLCRHHGRVLADGGYRGVHELITPVFRANRIVRDHRWRRHRRRRARIEHAIARLKDWRVLRDHRRRGSNLPITLHAVAFLHNLRIELRDIA